VSFLDQFGSDEARTVAEYTRQIKQLLEGNVAPSWIRGEISNLRRQSSGHIYFTLKDQSAQLPVAMFRGNASGLSFEPKDGMEAIVYGEISVYEPYGRYQLIARAMVESGAGRLHREFERLKKKLQEEGLFDKELKKRIPLLPRTVGIVTSPTGAAVQDFLRIVKRRGWEGRIIVLPVKVQGAGAAEEISSAIELADRSGLFDLLVIGRGGGSLEDLWCFNEEIVARAIAAAESPLISAVGHEVDFTLSDFAADMRAETPSAAAELITSSFVECIRSLELIEERLEKCADGMMSDAGRSISDIRLRLRSVSPERRLEMLSMRIDDLRTRLDHTASRNVNTISRRMNECRFRLSSLRPDERLRDASDSLLVLANRMDGEARNRLSAVRSRIDLLKGHVEGMSPKATLKRGYAMLLSEKGEAISEVEKIPENKPVRAILKDGETRLRKA